MSIPEPPLADLPTATSFSCPCCSGRIATWVVSARFICPGCGKPLCSNKGQAFMRGLRVGAFSWLCLSVLMHMVAPHVLAAFLYATGFIIAFYIGHFTYRSSVSIRKWENEPPR